MNEAKSLVNMAVSAIFSVMIIAGVLVLVGLGYTMWAYFSRQDAANQQMKDYVNYVAYDDATILGQEVISLFQYSEQEGLFIALWSDTAGTEMSNLNCGSNVHIYVPDACPWESIKANSSRIPTSNVNANIETAYINTVNSINANANARGSGRTACCFNQFKNGIGELSYDKLVQGFTNNYPASGAWTHLGGMDATGAPTKGYAAYRSYLVYDSETSTDVVGFILLRQNKDVTNFD